MVVGTDPWWVWVWVWAQTPMGIPTQGPKQIQRTSTQRATLKTLREKGPTERGMMRHQTTESEGAKDRRECTIIAY